MSAVIAYGIYTTVSLALTFYIARTLYRHGGMFLEEVFDGDKDVANAVNHLLVVGFWLINFGYIALTLKVSGDLDTARQGFEALALKLGGVSLVLGAMHFFNLFVLTRMKRNRRVAKQGPAAPMMMAPWAPPSYQAHGPAPQAG